MSLLIHIYFSDENQKNNVLQLYSLRAHLNETVPYRWNYYVTYCGIFL